MGDISGIKNMLIGKLEDTKENYIIKEISTEKYLITGGQLIKKVGD